MNRIFASAAIALACLTAHAEPAAKDVARCKALEQQINQVEQQMRQPQSGPTQDRLKADMQRLRDEQFALKC